MRKAFTLKHSVYGLQLEWILLWEREDRLPTHGDFKAKYGDEYYEPFHKDEVIVELVEKP